MSSHESHEDLEAGGEGEMKNQGVENADKTESAKSGSIATSKSAVAVKSGPILETAIPSGLKSGSISKTGSAVMKSGSISKTAFPRVLKSESISKSGSAVAAKSGSISRTAPRAMKSASISKSGSVVAVKSGSISRTVKRASISKTALPRTVESGSVLQNESALALKSRSQSKSSVLRENISESILKSSESYGTPAKGPSSMKMTGEEMRKSSLKKTWAESSREGVPEVILEEKEEEQGVRKSTEHLENESMRPSGASSSSIVAVALKRSHTLAQSGLWSRTSSTLASKMYSSVIDSVASSHAFRLADSEARVSTSTTAKKSTAALLAGSQDSRLLDRSVWKDPEVIDLLGKMRLDALGENVIWSREGSEGTLPEGLFTQFDIEEAAKPDKVIDQIMAYKDEVRSLKDEFSQAGSLITTMSPSEIPVPELEAERVPTRSVSLDPALFERKISEPWTKSPGEPSKESIVVMPEPTRLPSPVFCDLSKLTCLTKELISTKEISTCPAVEKAPVEATVVHVRFRLATGPILKRIYKPDVIFLDTLSELSQILCVPEDALQLFFKNEPLNFKADVRLCKEPGAEVLVVADVRPDHLFCLLEKGIISFEDDRALELFLLRQVPCVAEKHSRPALPSVASASENAPHPSSFIPGSADHRKRDSSINGELERQVELANSVRRIQSSFRCYLSKRTIPCKEQPVSQADMKAPNILMKDPELLTIQNFTLLYSMLGKWWSHEADAIKRDNSGAAKIARLYNLLLREIAYMRLIEKQRWKLKERQRSARAFAMINNIAANDCSWEYVRGFLPLWKRVQILLCSTKVSCKHLTCKKCSVNRKAMSRDIDSIIGGNYTRRQPSCRCLCYTCRRFLPCRKFPLNTDTARIERCEKCLGLSDVSATRSLMKKVRKEETKLGSRSWLSHIMQDRDFATLAKLWHNVSALSGTSCDLCFVRWDPDEEWSPWNTVLLTQEEAGAHRPDAYGPDFVDTVRRRHLTAKWTFRNLIQSEKVVRGRTRAQQDNCPNFQDRPSYQQSLQDSLRFSDTQKQWCFKEGQSFRGSQSLSGSRNLRGFKDDQSSQNMRCFQDEQSFQASQSFIQDSQNLRCFQDGQSFQNSENQWCFKEGQSFQGSQSLPDSQNLRCFEDGQSFQGSQSLQDTRSLRRFQDEQSCKDSQHIGEKS